MYAVSDDRSSTLLRERQSQIRHNHIGKYRQYPSNRNSMYQEGRSGSPDCRGRGSAYDRQVRHSNCDSKDRYKQQDYHDSQDQLYYDCHYRQKHHNSQDRRNEYYRQDRHNNRISQYRKNHYDSEDRDNRHDRENSLRQYDRQDSSNRKVRHNDPINQERYKRQDLRHEPYDNCNKMDYHKRKDHNDSQSNQCYGSHGCQDYHGQGRRDSYNHLDRHESQDRQSNNRDRLDRSREPRERRDEWNRHREKNLYRWVEGRRYYYTRRERVRRHISRARTIRTVQDLKSANLNIDERHKQLDMQRRGERVKDWRAERAKKDRQEGAYSPTNLNMQHQAAKKSSHKDCEDESESHEGCNDVPQLSNDADEPKMEFSGETSPTKQIEEEDNVDPVDKFFKEVHTEMQDIHRNFSLVWHLLKKVYLICKLKQSGKARES